MSRRFVFNKLVLIALCAAFLSACGAPAFRPPAEGAIIFVAPDERKFPGNIYGQGETAVILGNMAVGGESQWDPFVEAVDKEQFTVVTFSRIHSDDEGIVMDTQAVFEQLRDSGYQSVICIGASMGVKSCGAIAAEPEMIGLVLVAGGYSIYDDAPTAPVSQDVLGQLPYPKLFIAGETDPAALATQEMYGFTSEPKTLVLFPGEGLHGTTMFTSTAHGQEFIQTMIDFINGLVDQG